MPESANTAVDQGSGLRAGDLVAGRYRIERILGSGGMGIVVAAVDETTGEPVAVKILRSAADTRSVERFFREARAMGRIESEHVVRVRDAGVEEGQGGKTFLVMDRLEGMDLSERAKRSGPLSARDAADLVIQACEALSHAHSKGIVHRDVKPSNLFLHTAADRTVLKVLDFGISKMRSADVWERTLTTTDDGGVLGSPPYMSPEQVRDPKAVDPRSDVWSLGVVLYKLLAGTVPFDGDSVGEVFAKVLERPYPPLRVTTDVPEAIDALVEKCLAKSRDERWQSVGELALALAPFASPELAAVAPRIEQRMHDEGPTLERPSAQDGLLALPPVSRKGRGEARTLTVSEPPPAAASAPASIAPPPVSHTAAPSLTGIDTGSVALDVVPAAPGRARVAIVMIGIGLAVVAGIGIGLAVRGGGAAGEKGTAGGAESAATVVATAAAPGPSASATSTSTSTSTSASASATGSAGAAASVVPTGKRRGKKTPAAAIATGRPELQPSPYPSTP